MRVRGLEDGAISLERIGLCERHSCAQEGDLHGFGLVWVGRNLTSGVDYGTSFSHDAISCF